MNLPAFLKGKGLKFLSDEAEAYAIVVVSEPGNDKRASSERLRPSRLQDEIAALKRSPAHWAKYGI